MKCGAMKDEMEGGAEDSKVKIKKRGGKKKREGKQGREAVRLEIKNRGWTEKTYVWRWG